VEHRIVVVHYIRHPGRHQSLLQPERHERQCLILQLDQIEFAGPPELPRTHSIPGSHRPQRAPLTA
jgi:hypothetical protein